MSKTWQELVADKQRRQQASIPPEWLLKDSQLPSADVLNVIDVPESCGLLSEKEIAITNSPVELLLPALAKGQYSAVETTTAFYKRAIIAHQLESTNCLTEIFVDKALERAAELDEYLKVNGTTMGALHGLPVSLKDQINLAGIESTMGYVSWIGTYAEQNSVLVDNLLSLGAIPFVKTNIPQTLMWPETYNRIFGRTTNPHNRSLTCGGSSGGEGALIAMKGSPLGVGSDIGGSIRIPSSFVGLFGMRPSCGRIPYAGCVNSLEGQDSVLSVLGPLSQSIAGIKSFMQGVLSQKPWYKDPLVHRRPWNEEEYNLCDHGAGRDPLCFAILWDDGYRVPHPPVTRGLEMVKEALIVAGHTVVDWKAQNHKEICECLRGIWGAGANEDYTAVTSISGEPLITSMDPDGVTFDEDNLPAFRPGLKGLSAYELFQLQKKKRGLRQEYLRRWEDTVDITGTGRPVDVIISPTCSSVATPHGKNKRVDQKLDVKRPAHKFYNKEDESHYHMYDPAIYAEAPISIQLVGRTQEEEALIGMSEILDEALKKAKV
ncbi:general amidase [Mycena floridula]|nr:general amidase [Mycena floridula]